MEIITPNNKIMYDVPIINTGIIGYGKDGTGSEGTGDVETTIFESKPGQFNNKSSIIINGYALLYGYNSSRYGEYELKIYDNAGNSKVIDTFKNETSAQIPYLINAQIGTFWQNTNSTTGITPGTDKSTILVLGHRIAFSATPPIFTTLKTTATLVPDWICKYFKITMRIAWTYNGASSAWGTAQVIAK